MGFAETSLRRGLATIVPKAEQHNDDYIISYRQLRMIVGIIGCALPVVLVLGNAALFRDALAPSISDYYHTSMRNWFVGSMCAIGVFLLSYRGPERQDDWLGDAACIFALAVALFPPHKEGEAISSANVVHYVSAGALFLVLAIFCLALFTKTDKEITPAKASEIRFYRLCGWTIIVCIVMAPICSFLLKDDFTIFALPPVLVLESIAVLAFGASWFRKGKQGQPQLSRGMDCGSIRSRLREGFPQ